MYKAFCDKTGLITEFLEESTPVAYFNNKTDMEAFLRSWLPHTDQVHPQLRDKFINAIGNRFLEKISYSQGLIGISFKRLDAVLTKFLISS